MAKFKKSEVLAAILRMVEIDEEIAKLQDAKKEMKIKMYETYGKDAFEIFQLPSATNEGHSFVRIETEEVIKEEVKYTFLKKQPEEWTSGKKKA
jgi:hypothetical protein